MREIKAILSRLRLLAVCVLLLTFISGSMNLPGLVLAIQSDHLLTQKNRGNFKSDSGLPVGETENEPENRLKDKGENVGLIQVTLLNSFLNLSELYAQRCEKSTRYGHLHLPHSPIYLVTHALLI